MFAISSDNSVISHRRNASHNLIAIFKNRCRNSRGIYLYPGILLITEIETWINNYIPSFIWYILTHPYHTVNRGLTWIWLFFHSLISILLILKTSKSQQKYKQTNKTYSPFCGFDIWIHIFGPNICRWSKYNEIWHSHACGVWMFYTMNTKISLRKDN